MKIITVTLNPSLDETLVINHLNIGYRNHVAATKHLDASGRGVNVSRALGRLDIPTHAVVVLGDDTLSHAYRGLLMEEPFKSSIIRHPGPTRSDTIILDCGEGTKTHILDEDSVGPRENIQKVIRAVTRHAEPGDIVVCAGALPRDTAPDVYARLTAAAQLAGAEVVVMTRGAALTHALPAAPDTVVVTQLEAEGLFNYPVRTILDMRSAARKLRDWGSKRVLIVMTGYAGALLLDDDKEYVAQISEPAFTGTDSGVVDALLAGFLAGLSSNIGVKQAFKLGAAAMAFTAEQVGNEFGTLEQLKQMTNRVRVSSMNSRAPGNIQAVTS
jgi:1-phosphofructokinase